MSSIAALIIAAALTPPGDGAGPDESSVPACCRPGDARAAAIVAAAGRASADGTSDDIPAAGDSSVLDPEILAILDAVDAQTVALRDFSSTVRMDAYDELADETQRRFGHVHLRSAGPDGTPPRVIAVVFERTIEPGGRARERLEHFIYRDGVLSDYDHEAKRLVRRRWVEEGDDRDPLRLGEGPIPLPFVQRKADIIKGFEITRGPAIPQRLRLPAIPTGVRGVHLVPKAGTLMAEQGVIRSVDLWVHGDSAVPVAVEVQYMDGDRMGMRFLAPRVDQGLDETSTRWLVPPAIDESTWRIEES